MLTLKMPSGTSLETPWPVTIGEAIYPRATRRHRVFGGLTERQEHVFNWCAVVVVLLYVTAWVGAIAHMREVQRELIRQAKITHVPAPPPPAPVAQIAAAISTDSP